MKTQTKNTYIVQRGTISKGDTAVDIPLVNEIEVRSTAVVVRYYLGVISARGLLDGAAPVVVRAAERWAISIASCYSSCDVIRYCQIRN